MPFIALRDQNIFFEDTGGAGPALVFSHGLLMDGSMFAGQVEKFREKWRCVTWDARGHGRTADLGNLSPYETWDAAEGLVSLFDHLGIERAVLVGTSEGGFHALRCALLHPSRVAALVLIGTQAGPETAWQNVGNRALADMWLENGPTETLVKNTEQLLLGDDFAGAGVWRDTWWGLSPQHFLTCLSTFGEREDLTALLGGIGVPVLVLHGARDLAVPLARGQALARALGTSATVVEGAGHAASLTHPDAVNAVLQAFLEALPDDAMTAPVRAAAVSPGAIA